MLYAKPSMKNESKAGYLESYHLDSENMNFAIHTVVGGYEAFEGLNNKNRFAYVLRGIGTAIYTPEDRTVSDLLEGVSVEIPAGQPFKMDGQLRYALVGANGETKLSTNRKGENTVGQSGNDSTLIFVLDGIGNIVIDGHVHVLKEETLVEVPPNTVYELRGNFEYIVARGE